jgi:hypothetical protein
MLAEGIPTEPPTMPNGNAITKSLAEVVKLENEWLSISQMQKKGRKSTASKVQKSVQCTARKNRNVRTAAKQAASAISEMAVMMPIPKRRRK